jgi:hypothetical protein
MSGDLFGSLLRLKSEPCQSAPDVDPTVSKRRVVSIYRLGRSRTKRIGASKDPFFGQALPSR